MPIYGYRCENCDHELDALQKVSDEPLKDCPECGQSSLKRQLSAPRFRLKGQGWYETDFKKDNKRNLVDSKSEAKPKDSKDGDAKKSGADSSGKKDSSSGGSKPDKAPA